MTDFFFMLLGIYLFAINFAGAVAVLVDKHRAKKGKWRVPEKTLFLLAGLGGVAGVYLAMRAVRHKTLHKRFMIGLPAIFIAQVALTVGALVLWLRAAG
jgi:uncharacterized membrane protein YsdA (DUF1294 family)